MIHLLLKGIIIGFAIAAPVGPIGILCIQRSLNNGFKIGFSTGLGAAFADGVYGIISGFGLTVVSNFLINYKHIIQIVGGLFLICMGIKIVFSKSSGNDGNCNAGKIDKENSSLHAMLTTFLLTLSNPTTILSFIAVFAGLGVGSIHTDYLDSSFLVLGVIIGSGLWWLLLAFLVEHMLRHRLSKKLMSAIKILSGLIILLFGIVAIALMFTGKGTTLTRNDF